jgi:hypothetical protein
MNLTGIAFKISGWAMVALASVSLPIIGYGIAEWGFGLEDALGLTFFVIIPAIAGKFLIPMGNKSLQTNSISKRERTAFQIAHQSGGKITVMELSINSSVRIPPAPSNVHTWPSNQTSWQE